MKLKTSLALTTLTLVTGLFLANCKKEQTAGITGPQSAGISEPSRFLRYSRFPDRIDQIVGDLAQDQYSLSFEKPIPSAGITKTAYGADNYLVYADPQDLICPEPFRFKLKRVPIWKIPHYIQPTCPDMIIDISKFNKFNEFLHQVDAGQFGKLKEVTLSNGGAILGGEEFFSQFANMQYDKMDDLLGDLDQERFMLFNAPGDYSRESSRSFYGNADLNENVFVRYRISLKDILKPTLKGCFDPIILETIKRRLEDINPALYQGLNVNPLDDAGNAAVLSF